MDIKLNTAIKDSDIDLSKCESVKVENIKRKVKAVMGKVEESDEHYIELVNTYIKFYMRGIELMKIFSADFPEVYGDINELLLAYKKKVYSKTMFNSDKSLNAKIFNEILEEFGDRLEKEFKYLSFASVIELQHDMVAGWLAVIGMDENFLMTDMVIFDAKPDAVPYRYRISYKIGQICLILNICGGSSCSFLKLQMISNALNDKKCEKELLEFCDDNNLLFSSVIRFDPAVNRVLGYALADGFIKQLVKGTYKLTEKGKKFVKKIKLDKEVMSNEIEFLERIGNRLSEEKISELMDRWRYIDVGNSKIKNNYNNR